MNIINYSSLFVIILFFSCTKNAILPNSDTEITGTMALNKLKAPKDKALVYLVRPSLTVPRMQLRIFMDKELLGLIKGKQFLYTFAEPGIHTFFGKGENISKLPIKLEAGQVYFIEQIPDNRGLVSVRNKLKRLDDREGTRKLRACFLSADNSTTTGFSEN